MPGTGRASKGRDVLFAGVGMSPGVVTETIWALAHRREPILPDWILVLTTTAGRRLLTNTLFDNGGWDRLIKALKSEGIDTRNLLRFGPASQHFAMLPKPDGSGDLEDIVTAADSEAAADCILRALRGLTEEPDTRVIASIAGGRKTLSALITSCMSLLGRSSDILCHVLVNPPYDAPTLKPPFLFPETGTTHRLPGQKKGVASIAARIELTELPVVKVRGLYEREFRRLPDTYMSMVDRIQGMAPEAANYPQVTVHLDRGTLSIGGRQVELSAPEFATAALWLVSVAEGIRPTLSDMNSQLLLLSEEEGVDPRLDWFHSFAAAVDETREQASFARKRLSSLRAKIREAVSPGVAAQLVPRLRGRPHFDYPTRRIRIHGDRALLNDIR